MKIAIATTQLFNGGVEVLFRGLAKQIQDAGHEVVVYTRQLQGPLLRGYIENNIPLVMGPPFAILNEFDAVIVWSMHDHAQALKGFRGKIINYVGNTKPGYFSPEIFASYRIDGHIVDSENTREFVESIDPDANTAVWYYMSPPEELQVEPAYHKYGLKETQNIVGTLCAHRAVKNIPRLIDAFAKAEVANSVFAIAGSGPATEEWKKYGEKKLGNRCKFVGMVPHTEIGDFLSCCSVFLNQYNEGLGGRCLTVSEAFGAGCYIITNEHGGAKENILTDNGIVINDDVFDEEAPKWIADVFKLPPRVEARRRNEAREAYAQKHKKQDTILEWIMSL